MKARILFILKQFHLYGNYAQRPSSGLVNSARMVVDMLNSIGFTAALVEVNDNNDIDREVTGFRPTHVVIEALWVVPEKFAVLIPLHPTVRWWVRLHSEIPFLANEGMAMDWIWRYIQYPQVKVAVNSPRIHDDLLGVGIPTLLLPNYYRIDPDGHRVSCPDPGSKILQVACFGAIRPLKNQLLQAMAAIRVANQRKQTLVFHVNGDRCEMEGENILKNLRALFAGGPHVLMEHAWQTHDALMAILRLVDVGMQVSFTETFDITAADMLAAGLPIVVSREIAWASPLVRAETTSGEDIASKLTFVLGGHGEGLRRQSLLGLSAANIVAQNRWREALER